MAKQVEKPEERRPGDEVIRMPNVFVELKQVLGLGESGHLRTKDLLLNATGMGLLILAALSTSLDNTAALPEDLRGLMSAALVSSMAVFLIAFSFMKARAFTIFGNPWGGAGACAVNTVALFAMMVLPQLDAFTACVLCVVCGCILGISLSIIALYWAYVTTRMYIPDIASCAILAFSTAMVVYVLMLAKVPPQVEHLICALCPLASAPFLLYLMNNSPAVPDTQGQFTYYERRYVWGLFIYKVALPLLCVGIMMRIFLTDAQRSIMFDLDVIHLLGLVITIAVAGVIANCAIYGVRTSVQSFARFLSVVIPLIALVATPMAPSESSGITVVNTSLLASVCLILALSWTFLSAATLEYSYAPACTFGLGIGSFVAGLAIGYPILLYFPNDSPFFALVVGMVCFLMVFGFLPPRRAPNLSRSTYSQKAAERANAVAQAVDEEDGIASGRGTAQGTETELARGAFASAFASTGEKRATVGTGADATAGGAEIPAEPAGITFPGAIPNTRTTTSSADNAVSGAQAPGDERQQKGRFVRRCERVATMYLLSNRETEVLIHLAKGRSMNYIKDALVISEGTAKTHISHVYKKLDVHSRHELVELIESVEAD